MSVRRYVCVNSSVNVHGCVCMSICKRLVSRLIYSDVHVICLPASTTERQHPLDVASSDTFSPLKFASMFDTPTARGEGVGTGRGYDAQGMRVTGGGGWGGRAAMWTGALMSFP